MDGHKPTTALFDVYLRLRPSTVERERFLDVEDLSSTSATPTHITIKPPADDKRKRAVEKFAFTRVFEEDAGQTDIFTETGAVELIEGVLGREGREGRDGIVATLGVTGSGKSHTILGSRSQRGLTQLTLDLLFAQTEPYLADIEGSPTAFSSLCQADASEAQMFSAGQFLESLYADAHGASRATTPALVRDSFQPHPDSISGAFPDMDDAVPSTPRPVYDRLYPSMSKYQLQQLPTDTSKSHSPMKHLSRSIAKLTGKLQETSFISAYGGGSSNVRRYMPRVSLLPTTPSVDHINIPIDSTAEYAVVVSMYEVYNDRIFDLLSIATTAKAQAKQRRALLFKPTELSPDRKVVAGLRKVVCSNLEEALIVLETGLQERRVAGTGSNSASSRSHGFFCFEVKKRRRGVVAGPWSSSTLTIVDLAGSERARAAKTTGSTLAEAGKINESLMYLGQCMQMQSDAAHSLTPTLVPYRQCKLTELLFSNAFAPAGNRLPQKAIMIVTADPLGDFNATSQILRYSALAREVTVPRIPSVTSTILAAAPASKTGRVSPTATAVLQDELSAALSAIAQLRADLELASFQLDDERRRRQEAEAAWQAAEQRIEDVEAEVREEVFIEMEAQMAHEQRRWRAAREAELDHQDEHIDRKLEILARGIGDYDEEEFEKENVSPGETETDGKEGKAEVLRREKSDLAEENARLKERLALRERETGMRTPSKKMRVLKSKRWDGSGMGVDDY